MNDTHNETRHTARGHGRSLHIDSGNAPLYVDLGAHVTKRGIKRETTNIEIRPVETDDELAGLYGRITGTHIHAAGAALALRKNENDYNITEVPDDIRYILSELAGTTPEEIGSMHFDTLTHRITRTLSHVQPEILRPRIDLLIQWATGIHRFDKPNIQFKNSAAFDLYFIEDEIYRKNLDFYAVSVAMLSLHPWFQDPNTVLFPEIGVYPHVKNLSRLISNLQNPRQDILPVFGLGIKNLDTIDVLGALNIDNNEDAAMTLHDILVNFQDPSWIFIKAHPAVVAVLASVGITQAQEDLEPIEAISASMVLQEMNDIDFVKYANNLLKHGMIFQEDIPKLAALYITCKAQAEFQFFIGTEASLSEIQTLDDVSNILNLANIRMQDPMELLRLEDAPSEYNAYPFSGRFDYLAVQVRPRKKSKLTQAELATVTMLRGHAYELYKKRRQPNLQDSIIMQILDETNDMTNVNINVHLMDIKTSLFERVPQSIYQDHVREMDFYARMYLQIIYGLRRTTHRTFLQSNGFDVDQPDALQYPLDALRADFLASALRTASVLYIHGFPTKNGPVPEVRQMAQDNGIDLDVLIDRIKKENRGISIASQARRRRKDYQ